ncbi:MAG: protein kinase [Phycisphaera sp.]|nr:protein kinase [Phycisphaera sp.]
MPASLEVDDADEREHGRRVRRLFDEILNLNALEREDVLQSMIGQDPAQSAIAEEVRSLLAFVDATRVDAEADSEPDANAPHSLLGCRIGDFTLERLIGFGGTSFVFEANQHAPNRKVAVKVLRSGLAGPRARRRFDREVEIAGRIEHSSVARIVGSGRIVVDGDETPWLAMEFVPGAESITRFAEQSDLDLRGRVRLLREAISGIVAAHLRGVIHRDIKPGNVLVDDSGRIRIIDFGIARMADADSGLAGGMMTATIPGQVLGTVPFMAPEQLGGDPEAVDVRTDVYGLGVLAHLLLTGRMPYEVVGCDFIEAARRIKEVEVGSLRRLGPKIDRDLDGIVQKALAKDPAARYQSAESLEVDLEAWLDGRAVTARPLGLIGRNWRNARRHPVPTMLGATVVVGIIGATIILSLMLARESRLRSSADRAAADAGLAAAAGALRQGDLGGVHRYLESIPSSERGWEYGWLSSVVARDDVVLENGFGDILSVDLIPATPERQATLLATGYRGTSAYGLPGLELRWRLKEFTEGGSWKHAKLPDEDLVVVCGLGPVLKLLDLGSGEVLRTFATPGNVGEMWGLGDEWILIGGDDGRLSRMNLRDGRIEKPIDLERGGITSILGLQDGRILVGTSQGSLLETDAELTDHRLVRKFPRMIPRLRADAAENRIAVCTHDDSIEVVDAATLETIIRFDDHVADVWDARFDEKNDRIVSVSLDESMRVFDLKTGEAIERRSGPFGYIWSLALEGDGKHAWIGCKDGSVRRLELRESGSVLPTAEFGGRLAWSPNGKSIVVLTDRGLHRMDLENRRWVASAEVVMGEDVVTGASAPVVWSSSGIWCGSGRGGSLWRFDPDLKAGTKVLPDVGVSALAAVAGGGILVALDDRRILRVSQDGAVESTVTMNRLMQDIEIHPVTGEAYCLATGRSTWLNILDVESLQIKRLIDDYGVGPSFSLAIAPDGSNVALGARERPGNVIVVPKGFHTKDAQTRRIGHSGDARFVTFVDDGRRLVSGGDDGRIVLGRPDAMQPMLAMFESRSAIRGLAASPDGRSIAATDGRRVYFAHSP